jgi:hypothetical protein
LTKTQVYASSEEDLGALKGHFPTAAVQRHAWSLGFPLPTGFGIDDDNAAANKLLNRYTSAAQCARRAACLPHGLRYKVLLAIFGSKYAHGIEYEPPKRDQEKQLCQTFYNSMTVGSRPNGSRLVFWTVLYKGHRFHPLAVYLESAARYLRNFWGGPDRHVFEDCWQNPPPETPLHHFRSTLHRMGWRWTAPMEIRGPYPADAHDRVVSLTGDPECISHDLRQLWRYYLFRTARPRNDMAGIEHGIDRELTCGLYHTGKLTAYEEGMLRTLLLGALWTAGRMHFAGLLEEDEARCPHCPTLDLDTIGHRWVCPRGAHARQRLRLSEIDVNSLPKCLTRCGVVPVRRHDDMPMPTWRRAEVPSGDHHRSPCIPRDASTALFGNVPASVCHEATACWRFWQF